MISLLKDNWPLLLIVLWFSYRWWKMRSIKKILPHLLKNGAVVVDVRTEGEFSMGSAPGSLNIPLNELKERANELTADRPVILCCASGTRSAFAARLLKARGFKKIYNIGSWVQLIK